MYKWPGFYDFEWPGSHKLSGSRHGHSTINWLITIKDVFHKDFNMKIPMTILLILCKVRQWRMIERYAKCWRIVNWKLFSAKVTEEKPLGKVGHGWHTHIFHHSSAIYRPLKRNKALIILIIKALNTSKCCLSGPTRSQNSESRWIWLNLSIQTTIFVAFWISVYYNLIWAFVNCISMSSRRK